MESRLNIESEETDGTRVEQLAMLNNQNRNNVRSRTKKNTEISYLMKQQRSDSYSLVGKKRYFQEAQGNF